MDGDSNKLKKLQPTLPTVAIDISLSLSAQPGGTFLALLLVGVGIHPICVDGGHRQTSSVGAQYQCTTLAPMPTTTVGIRALVTSTVAVGISSSYANRGYRTILSLYQPWIGISLVVLTVVIGIFSSSLRHLWSLA
jgi:hypothetical protein